MMKVLYSNAKKTIQNIKTITNYVKEEKVDVVILAEGNDVSYESLKDYIFSSKGKLNGRYGIKVFSNYEINILVAINYLPKELDSEKFKSKLVKFSIGKYDFLAVHIPAQSKPFMFAMEKVIEELAHNKNLICLGDFNFGYSDESPKGGLKFEDCVPLLNKMEKMGVKDTQYGKKQISHRHFKKNTLFRLDHVFSAKNIDYTYVGKPISNDFWDGFDHKPMLFNLK